MFSTNNRLIDCGRHLQKMKYLQSLEISFHSYYLYGWINITNSKKMTFCGDLWLQGRGWSSFEDGFFNKID